MRDKQFRVFTNAATMTMDRSVEQKDNLPRLLRHHYQGHAVVLWTLTLEHRATGWLKESFHLRFRELMLHAAAREKVWCPTYCLMPDHLHLVWMGMRRESDQLNAMRFLRRQIAPSSHTNSSTKPTTTFCARMSVNAAHSREFVSMYWQIQVVQSWWRKARGGRSAE